MKTDHAFSLRFYCQTPERIQSCIDDIIKESNVKIVGFEKNPLTISCNFFIPTPEDGQENCEVLLFFESVEGPRDFMMQSRCREIYTEHSTTVSGATLRERNIGDTAFEV